MYESFRLANFLARWLVALFVVLATYNPSGYSYVDWVVGPVTDRPILKILIGILLVILYATFILATLRSLGVVGVIGWALLFAALIWFMIDIGVIERITFRTVVTIMLVVLANLIAVGLSWSYVRLRLSGQADTNNVTLR